MYRYIIIYIHRERERERVRERDCISEARQVRLYLCRTVFFQKSANQMRTPLNTRWRQLNTCRTLEAKRSPKTTLSCLMLHVGHACLSRLHYSAERSCRFFASLREAQLMEDPWGAICEWRAQVIYPHLILISTWWQNSSRFFLLQTQPSFRKSTNLKTISARARETRPRMVLILAMFHRFCKVVNKMGGSKPKPSGK